MSERATARGATEANVATPRPASETTNSPDAVHAGHLRAKPIATPWLTYAEAAAYTGWSLAYLRNLVSAGRVPVYGKPRVRRFRRDMLDLFLTDPDAAMRQFHAERNTHGS